MSTQLDQWCGQFGRDYEERNRIDWRTRVDALRRIIPGDVNDVLEVGCNVGTNLIALSEAFGDRIVARGIEPADHPRRIAQARGLGVTYGTANQIPAADLDYDLVFTSGVLIHIPPDRLHEAMRELARVARSYVLAIEYFAAEDVEEPYRDLDEMLWKRDYGLHYLRACPDLKLIGMGDDCDGFEGARWWLLKKS